jgi:hypothetical protein
LYSVPSAAAAGSTAAAGKAADNAAVEQIPFIRALLEKSELIKILLFDRYYPDRVEAISPAKRAAA